MGDMTTSKWIFYLPPGVKRKLSPQQNHRDLLNEMHVTSYYLKNVFIFYHWEIKTF